MQGTLWLALLVGLASFSLPPRAAVAVSVGLVVWTCGTRREGFARAFPLALPPRPRFTTTEEGAGDQLGPRRGPAMEAVYEPPYMQQLG